MAKQAIPAFAQSGASPPDAKTTNYTINVVRFRVVRETGVSRARQAPLSTPAAVAALAAQIIPDDAREHFGVLMLDAQNRLVVYHEVPTGTLSASLVHPREVFGPALRVMGVASIILVHNHPSGEPAPSREDLRLTKQLVEAGKLLDITVHDHVILGTGAAYVSFADRGLL
jgi:DNA repair protein RadC